jgi:hypothetical protein
MKSEDGGTTWAYGGTTWNKVTWGLFNSSGRNYDVAAAAVDPSNTSIVYISTAGGLFKSTDGGGSWTLMHDAPAGDLAIDPVTPTTFYMSGGDSGVFKSTDGGLTWSALNAGLEGHQVGELAIDPRTPGTLYAATEAGVFVIRQEGAPENGAPLANAGPDQLVEATSPDGALVALDGSGSSDPDGDPLAFAWSWPAGGDRPAVRLSLGTTTVTLPVSDPYGATGTDAVEIRVRDTTPPEVAVRAPQDGAIVSGTINISAVAVDAVGVAGVRFLLDGEPLGPEDTSDPREVPWDTRTTWEGTHEAWTAANNEEVGVSLNGCRAVYASAPGATATFTFTGTGVRWLGFPCERCGVA